MVCYKGNGVSAVYINGRVCTLHQSLTLLERTGKDRVNCPCEQIINMASGIYLKDKHLEYSVHL